MEIPVESLALFAREFGFPSLALCVLLYGIWRTRGEIISREHHEQVVSLLTEQHQTMVELMERQAATEREELLRFRDLAFRLAQMTPEPQQSDEP